MEHGCFAFHGWKILQTRRVVSQWKQCCLLSELSELCVLRWEHVGDQCRTPLELVSDGRHESVQLSVALPVMVYRTLVRLFQL